MTSTTSESLALLRRILESFIAHTSHLEVGAKEMSSGVYFVVRSHPHDLPKIIGKQGTHVKALNFLFQRIGRNLGTPYIVQVKDGAPCNTPHPPDFTPIFAKQYDAQPIAGLLDDCLLAIGIDADVEPVCTTDAPPLCYDLEITDISSDQYAALIVPDPQDRDARTAIGSLGTLIRAAANKSGVKMQLVARRPSTGLA